MDSFRESIAAFRDRHPAWAETRHDFQAGERVLVALSDPAATVSAILDAWEAGATVALADPSWPRDRRTEARARARPHRVLGWEDSCEAPDDREETAETWVATGGTTGGLNFCRHDAVTLSAAALGLRDHLGGGALDSVGALPLWHVSGLMPLVRAIVTGGTFPVLSDWRLVGAGAPDGEQDRWLLSLVPTQLEGLLQAGSAEPLRTFRAIFVGGAGMGESLIDAAREAGLPVCRCYGATETAAMVTVQRLGDFLAGDDSCGVALPHVDVAIIAGRVAVRATSLFRGYVGQPTRTDPILALSDAGVLDEQDRLTILGRLDRVAISGGEKVDLERVETVLRGIAGVRDAAVRAVPDTTWGERLEALVATDLSRDSIEGTARESLASAERPRTWFLQAGGIRSGAGKPVWPTS